MSREKPKGSPKVAERAEELAAGEKDVSGVKPSESASMAIPVMG